MKEILEMLDQDIKNTRQTLDALAFSPTLVPGAELNTLVDDYHNYSAQRAFMEDRITALRAIRPLLIDAIEATEREQARQEAEAQRAIDAARIKELMAELATMEPGPRQSLLLVEISKLRGEL